MMGRWWVEREKMIDYRECVEWNPQNIYIHIYVCVCVCVCVCVWVSDMAMMWLNLNVVTKNTTLKLWDIYRYIESKQN